VKVVGRKSLMNVVEDGWKKARARQLCLKLSRNPFRSSATLFNYHYSRCRPAVNTKLTRELPHVIAIGIPAPDIPPWQCGFPIAGLLPQLPSSAGPLWPVAMRSAALSHRLWPARLWCRQKHQTCDTPRENQRAREDFVHL
jgi:hypothetical protein